MSTSFSTKCEILAEVYTESLWNEELSVFKNYNDVGLPLAYLVHNNMATSTDSGNEYVNETWEELCTALSVDSTKEYKNADDILEEAGIEVFGDHDDL